MDTLDQVKQLVDRFDLNKDSYLSPEYNETQARVELIDPLFGLLGWDVHNKRGYAEPYKDVVHEESLRIGRSINAPDYSFRIGGQRKFFLEAKKPATSIESDPKPAYQLRRYAYSAELPVSILTDFKELAVYDCTLPPREGDGARTARINYLRYDEYVPQWGWLASTFSREAVLKGSFDRFASSKQARRGTSALDKTFLKEIERWRKVLAETLIENNSLSASELNYAVQMTIDRIIFLRMAEDRSIEDYGRLQKLTSGKHVYRRLCELYRNADDKYDSGLFHFHFEREQKESPDELTLSLKIEDEPLKQILAGLYYPSSPYEYSYIPGDVLGKVYEQFLAKSVEVTSKGKIRTAEKPEVKKAGGIFYTPKQVVDYIVHLALGQLLEGKKAGPRGSASRLRILDPACGSGSFLLGAYSHLLEWHRRQYFSDHTARQTGKIYQSASGEWILSTTERKRILLNSIYGVDIDPQAVEVTKLALSLKVLEGESGQVLEKQLKMFQDRALPSLAENIKCGNSIVEPDYPVGEQSPTSAANPFSWRQGFHSIVDNDGGFDAVVTNPPYVSLQSGYIEKVLYEYLSSHFSTMERISDYFALFLERAIGLLAPNGVLGFILPATLLGNLSFSKLRKLILESCRLTHIVHLGDGVFEDAVVPTCVVVARKMNGSKGRFTAITNVQSLEHSDYEETKVSQRTLLKPPYFEFHLAVDDLTTKLIERLAIRSKRLENFVDVKEGIKTGNDGRFLATVPFKTDSYPVLKGRDIDRYTTNPCRYIHYLPDELARPQTRDHFIVPQKLLIRRVGDRLTAAYDEDQLFCVHTLYTARARPDTTVSLKYLLGLINSRLLNFCYRAATPQKGKVFPEVRIYSLNALPIRDIDLGDSRERRQHDELVGMVEQVITFRKEAKVDLSPHDQERKSLNASRLEQQIDMLVYRFYGLSKAEIELVEAASRKGNLYI